MIKWLDLLVKKTGNVINADILTIFIILTQIQRIVRANIAQGRMKNYFNILRTGLMNRSKLNRNYSRVPKIRPNKILLKNHPRWVIFVKVMSKRKKK